MAGSRTLKRVLGETNLERKCRRIFGVCMIVLVASAFFGVYWNAKDLAQRITFSKGRERVRVYIFDFHWGRFTTDKDEKILQRQMSRELLGEDYEGRFLSLEPEANTFPKVADEENILQRLKRQQEKQLAEFYRQRKQAKKEAADPLETGGDS